MSFKWLVQYLAGRVKLIRNGCHYEYPDSWNAFIAPDWSQKLIPTKGIFEKGQGRGLEGFVMVQAYRLYFRDIKRLKNLVGMRAHRWAYLADEYSLQCPAVLEIGLLHQEVLD